MAGLDVEFLTTWLVKNSDLSVDDCIDVHAKDPSALMVLLRAAVQLQRNLLIPIELRRKVIMMSFLDGRNLLWGQRLVDFKTKGGISADGRLQVKHLLGYKFEFPEDDDKPVMLIHLPTGDAVEVDEDAGVKEGMEILDCYDDYSCYFVRPPGLKVPLSSFFVSKGVSMTGPWKHTNYTKLAYKELVGDVGKLVLCREQVVSSTRDLPGQLKTADCKKVADHMSSKSAGVMEKARKAAHSKMTSEKTAAIVFDVVAPSPAGSGEDAA